MSVSTQQGDPDATIYEAVATLELKGYTKSEIGDALIDVAIEVDPDK